MTREGILKHKVMFDKWVSGEWIQFYTPDRGWVDVDDPEFNESFDVDRFRVKQADTMTDMKEHEEELSQSAVIDFLVE